MTDSFRNSFLLAALAAAVSCSAYAQKRDGEIYRWVDENGVVQFGDRIPPEHANRDRDVLNDQGVRVRFEEGEITPEERAEMERQEQLEAERAREHAQRVRRDRMLLETYLSVQDIENLRDRRLELLESQVKVTQLYLTNLRKRLESLRQEASRYQPYSDDENAPPLPENLATDIERTEQSLAVYEERLSSTREEQQELRESFAADIARFRELRGG